MPSRVYSVNDVFEIGGFSGEDGGFGDYSFNAGDVDFSIDKFIYSDPTHFSHFGVNHVFGGFFNENFK